MLSSDSWENFLVFIQTHVLAVLLVQLTLIQARLCVAKRRMVIIVTSSFHFLFLFFFFRFYKNNYQAKLLGRTPFETVQLTQLYRQLNLCVNVITLVTSNPYNPTALVAWINLINLVTLRTVINLLSSLCVQESDFCEQIHSEICFCK
jgi:hypothetical protein